MNFYNLNRQEVFSLADKINRSRVNLYNISRGHKKMGVRLAKQINEANPQFKLSELLPEVWANQHD